MLNNYEYIEEGICLNVISNRVLVKFKRSNYSYILHLDPGLLTYKFTHTTFESVSMLCSLKIDNCLFSFYSAVPFLMYQRAINTDF